MSGHSKWSKIKRAKETTDKKKGQVFGKFAKEIISVSRTEKDPSKNAALREVITRARKANMPQINIDRLLQNKGDDSMQTIAYEGFGPGGASLYISTVTDNPNRTVAEIRLLLKNNGGILGEPGSVRWKFKPVVLMSVELPSATSVNKEDVELSLIDAGAEDVFLEENRINVETTPENREPVEKIMQDLGGEFEMTATLSPLQSHPILQEDAALLKNLFEQLEEHSDVESVVTDSNFNPDSE